MEFTTLCETTFLSKYRYCAYLVVNLFTLLLLYLALTEPILLLTLPVAIPWQSETLSVVRSSVYRSTICRISLPWANGEEDDLFFSFQTAIIGGQPNVSIGRGQ